MGDRLIVAAAQARIGLALLVALFATATQLDRLAPLYFLRLLFILVFSVAGYGLVRGGRRDERAQALGIAFLLVAVPFGDSTITPFRGSDAPLAGFLRGIAAIPVDAFMPYYIWRFASVFPRAMESRGAGRNVRLMLHVTFVTGVLLVGAGGAWLVASAAGANRIAILLYRLSRHNGTGMYWPTMTVLTLASLPVVFARARRVSLDERRRTSLLAAGMLFGTLPTLIVLLSWAASPAIFARFPLRIAGWITYPTLLSFPLTTAYAVLARRALDVTLVVRRAVQHAFARYTLIAATSVPFILLVAAAYARRDQTVAHIAGSLEISVLLLLATAGVIVLKGRGRALDRIDRYFFREQYDARRILGELVDRCRWAGSHAELDQVLRREIDRALHLESIDPLFLSDEGEALVSIGGRLRPLERTSPLVALLARTEGALVTDLEHPDPGVAHLPAPEQHWLADGGISLLVPLRDAHDGIVGVIALGEKRSELPFSGEDRRLLLGVASAAEMTIAYHGLRPASASSASPAPRAPDDPVASECMVCGAVGPAGAAVCAECGGRTSKCLLPQIVGGKFRLERRLGEGAMGVAYRAGDLHLGRAVALKTLPTLSPERSVRLRREAKAMALVSHPNLAQIYGAESWQGRPILVVELASAGTLAARLARQPLSVIEMLDLGESLAQALIAIHHAGMLHRDIKPSNIALTSTGMPKLLDFGLARMLGVAREESWRDRTDREASAERAMATDSSLFGTPAYMSPEVQRGMPPDMSLDLWSTSLVLYECVAGHNPYIGGGDGRVPRVAAGGPPPDLREYCPHAAPAIADFFRAALSMDVAERPGDAAELRELLRALRPAGGSSFVPPELATGWRSAPRSGENPPRRETAAS